jgi:uncharacterized protein YecA (UPF0149 family)
MESSITPEQLGDAEQRQKDRETMSRAAYRKKYGILRKSFRAIDPCPCKSGKTYAMCCWRKR